jgi:hypothetical protein
LIAWRKTLLMCAYCASSVTSHRSLQRGSKRLHADGPPANVGTRTRVFYASHANTTMQTTSLAASAMTATTLTRIKSSFAMAAVCCFPLLAAGRPSSDTMLQMWRYIKFATAFPSFPKASGSAAAAKQGPRQPYAFSGSCVSWLLRLASLQLALSLSRSPL